MDLLTINIFQKDISLHTEMCETILKNTRYRLLYLFNLRTSEGAYFLLDEIAEGTIEDINGTEIIGFILTPFMAELKRETLDSETLLSKLETYIKRCYKMKITMNLSNDISRFLFK